MAEKGDDLTRHTAGESPVVWRPLVDGGKMALDEPLNRLILAKRRAGSKKTFEKKDMQRTKRGGILNAVMHNDY